MSKLDLFYRYFCHIGYWVFMATTILYWVTGNHERATMEAIIFFGFRLCLIETGVYDLNERVKTPLTMTEEQVKRCLDALRGK